MAESAINSLRERELTVKSGLTRFMRREAHGLTPDIHVRELWENSRVVNCTHAVGHIIWDRVASKGIYDMLFYDDGDGIQPKTMRKLGNVLEEADIALGKSDDEFTGNFNWGVRLTLLAMARTVIFVSTAKDEDGTPHTYLALLTSNGKLGIRLWTWEDERGSHTDEAIPARIFQMGFADVIEEIGFDPIKVHHEYLGGLHSRPSGVPTQSETGTTVFALDSVKHGHTYLGSHGYNRPFTRGNNGNLNKRIWEFADGQKVAFTEFHRDEPESWPKTEKEVLEDRKADAATSSGQINRTISGARFYITKPGPGGISGYIGGDGEELHIKDGALKGATIWWALRKEPYKSGLLAPFNDRGYVAILHENELFHHEPAVKYHFWRPWGITEKPVRERLFIIVKPPTRTAVDGSGVKMTSIRTTLEWAVDGEVQSISDLYDVAADYFRRNMPSKVYDALKDARGENLLDEDDDAKARQRWLERWADRLRRARNRKIKTGSRFVSVVDPGGTPVPGVGPSPHDWPELPGGGRGGRGGDPDYGPDSDKGDAAEQSSAGGTLPKFSTAVREWENEWTIATYQQTVAAGDEPTIYLNASHPFVDTYIQYWIDRQGVEGWDDGEKEVRRVCHEAYRDILWGTVTQARDLGGLGMTSTDVQEVMLSDHTLTGACMGVAHLDALVGPRIGPALSKLGPRPSIGGGLAGMKPTTPGAKVVKDALVGMGL